MRGRIRAGPHSTRGGPTARFAQPSWPAFAVAVLVDRRASDLPLVPRAIRRTGSPIREGSQRHRNRPPRCQPIRRTRARRSTSRGTAGFQWHRAVLPNGADTSAAGRRRTAADVSAPDGFGRRDVCRCMRSAVEIGGSGVLPPLGGPPDSQTSDLGERQKVRRPIHHGLGSVGRWFACSANSIDASWGSNRTNSPVPLRGSSSGLLIATSSLNAVPFRPVVNVMSSTIRLAAHNPRPLGEVAGGRTSGTRGYQTRSIVDKLPLIDPCHFVTRPVPSHMGQPWPALTVRPTWIGGLGTFAWRPRLGIAATAESWTVG